ncbi:MAG: M48 family metalloprotease, partial [Rhodocyclales bacterium]|nr:M48 family metalloprotease [Rhodocyclales bacterium]
MRRPTLARFLPILAVVAGCAVNPVTGKKELHLISEQEEVAMGRSNYLPGQQQSGGPYVLDPQLTAYVREVGQKLARVSDRNQLPYEFVILNDSVPNAWAMPGGKIAVNRGLLTELRSEAELAAVIGHEIVHAAGRHAARGMENGLLLHAGAAVVSAAAADRQYGSIVDSVAGFGAGLLGIKYGRDYELEADHYGMLYMQRAGYDPQAAVSLQETFVRLSGKRATNWIEGLFASHPPSPQRVEANRKFAAELTGNFITGEREYQAHIAPLLKTRPAYQEYDDGQQALKKNEAEKALRAAAAAIAIEPREALFYGLRGDAHAVLKRYAEA